MELKITPNEVRTISYNIEASHEELMKLKQLLGWVINNKYDPYNLDTHRVLYAIISDALDT